MKKYSLLSLLVLTILISQFATAAGSWTKKSSAEIQRFFNVQTNNSPANQQEKLKLTKEALDFHSARIQKEIDALPQRPAAEAKIKVVSSSLTAVTSNGNTTSLAGAFKIQVTGGKGGTFPYNTDVVLRDLQTGVEHSGGQMKLIPNESEIMLSINHKEYGNITVSNVPENAVKSFTAYLNVTPTGLAAANYVMEIRSIQYYNSDLLNLIPSTASLKTYSFKGQPNSVTGSAYFEGQAAYVDATSLTQNLSYGSKNNEVALLQKFLTSKGYLSESNGYELTFGEGTKAALINYQRAKGISPADGAVGPVTRAAINAEIVGPAIVIPPAITPTVPSGGNRRSTPPPTINGSGEGSAVVLPTTSYFKDFFKNMQAQTLNMFGR